jgi:hypothetical protein
MGLLFLIIGIFCIQRPRLIADRIASLFKGGGSEPPAWLLGRGMVFFIRLIGFLALVNAVMYFYMLRTPTSGP